MKCLEKKLKDIDDRVSRLRELSSDIASFEDYQASRNYREMVERNLQVAIEGCLDGCECGSFSDGTQTVDPLGHRLEARNPKEPITPYHCAI